MASTKKTAPKKQNMFQRRAAMIDQASGYGTQKKKVTKKKVTKKK